MATADSQYQWGSTIGEAFIQHARWFITHIRREESGMHTKWTNRGRAGQGLAEYALILSLIAIAAIVSLLFMSGGIQALLSAVGNAI
jgi:Flp pilus assembly pilin Flp